MYLKKQCLKEVLKGNKIKKRKIWWNLKWIKTEENINKELFKACFTDYQSPSNMYKKLSETKDAVNEIRVDFIKKSLRKLKRIIYYTPKYDPPKIEENENRDCRKNSLL